jgi:hypothetical protein
LLTVEQPKRADCNILKSQPFYERFTGSGAVNELEIANQELSQLAEEAVALAKAYWVSLKERPAYLRCFHLD